MRERAYTRGTVEIGESSASWRTNRKVLKTHHVDMARIRDRTLRYQGKKETVRKDEKKKRKERVKTTNINVRETKKTENSA